MTMKPLQNALLWMALGGIAWQALPSQAQALEGSKMPARAAPTAEYIDVRALDVEKILPPPPASGSVGALTDLETILQVQGHRTPEDAEWAGAIIKGDVFSYNDIVGAWFVEANLPATAGLFKKVRNEAGAATDFAKDIFKRERPYTISTEVNPCVTKPDGYSYPSGYAMQASIAAGILAELFPQRRAEIIAQAHQRSWARVVGGVHFPTDVVAGGVLSETVVAKLLANPAFRLELDKARAEIRTAAGKK